MVPGDRVLSGSSRLGPHASDKLKTQTMSVDSRWSVPGRQHPPLMPNSDMVATRGRAKGSPPCRSCRRVDYHALGEQKPHPVAAPEPLRRPCPRVFVESFAESPQAQRDVKCSTGARLTGKSRPGRSGQMVFSSRPSSPVALIISVVKRVVQYLRLTCAGSSFTPAPHALTSAEPDRVKRRARRQTVVLAVVFAGRRPRAAPGARVRSATGQGGGR